MAATRTGTFGRAGHGLKDASSWALNESVANIGRKGELRTAAVLDRHAAKTAIIHDMRVPIPGFSANIDHAVVSGKHVWLIDTKVWKPGWYWSLGGTNRRGLTKVPHVAKSPAYARDAIARHLSGMGAVVHPPILAVWPSNMKAALHLLNPNVPGAEVIPAHRLASRIRLPRLKPGNTEIVIALAELAA